MKTLDLTLNLYKLYYKVFSFLLLFFFSFRKYYWQLCRRWRRTVSNS